MKTLEFTKEIKATPQRVWQTLWSSDTYSKWTSAFSPNGVSTMQTDWVVGGKTFFGDGNGNGMVSTIAAKNEPHELVFKHLGEIHDGKEDVTSDKVKDWAGALEKYYLTENNGATILNVSVQVDEAWEGGMVAGFTKGLDEVKRLSEQTQTVADQPASTALKIVIPAYRMHTQMFNNIFEGIREADFEKRIEGKTNHIAWMAGNLVNCRYWLAGILGLADKDPNDQLFKDAKALDENAKYPSLEELKKEWHKISPLLYQRLLSISDAQLNDPEHFGMNVPFVEENKLNMVGMAIDRESYLFGQLGLMRKILGYEGVKYDVDETLKY